MIFVSWPCVAVDHSEVEPSSEFQNHPWTLADDVVVAVDGDLVVVVESSEMENHQPSCCYQ